MKIKKKNEIVYRLESKFVALTSVSAERLIAGAQTADIVIAIFSTRFFLYLRLIVLVWTIFNDRRNYPILGLSIYFEM